jgi:hypothetical protein
VQASRLHHGLLAKLSSLLQVLLVLCANCGSAAHLSAQPPVNDVYQDFRNKTPVGKAFHLGGLNPEEEIQPDNGGLLITLPAERERHIISEVNAHPPIVGDFEFTATYEILSARKPAKGYGVGVNLTVSTLAEPKKFGKLCRAFRAEEGSVFLGESWPKYQKKAIPSEAMSGQLRLARIGPALVFLVSAGEGKEFEPIWEVKDYGQDDIGYAGFQVTDSGEPGNPVQARLIDLRMRTGAIERDKLKATAPLAAPPAPVADEPAPAPPMNGGRRWLITILIVAVVLVLLFLAAIAMAWLFMRQKAVAKDS